MIRRPTRCRRIDTIKAQPAKIERIDERIDRANRIPLVDKVIEAVRQQRRLSPIRPFNEPLHRLPPQIARRIITATAFSRSQGQNRRRAHVRFWGTSGIDRHRSASLCARSRHEADFLCYGTLPFTTQAVAAYDRARQRPAFPGFRSAQSGYLLPASRTEMCVEGHHRYCASAAKRDFSRSTKEPGLGVPGKERKSIWESGLAR